MARQPLQFEVDVTHYPFFGLPAIYVDPAVVTFVATPAIAEIGSTVAGVNLHWELSKTPLTLKLGSVMLAPNETVAQMSGPFTTKQTWTLHMGDAERTVPKHTSLVFQNKAYWGNVASAPLNSAGILALENSAFATEFEKTIQYGSPNGKKPCFAFPVRFGLPKRVKIGVPTGLITPAIKWLAFTDFTVTTVAFTNPSGYTENYSVIVFNAARTDSSLLVEFH